MATLGIRSSFTFEAQNTKKKTWLRADERFDELLTEGLGKGGSSAL
jgi:hypothetical protein